MHDLLAQLPTLLKLCVSVLIFAIGLGATFRDLDYLWKRPGLMLRSLLAMYVLVPLAAVAFARWLPLEPSVRAGLLVLAVSAGAPLLPRKLSKFGGGAYVFSLVVLTSLLAIALVPAWVELLGRRFGADYELAPVGVAAVIGKAFLLPLVAGMTLRLWVGTSGERVSDVLIKIVGSMLTLCALALLALNGPLLLGVLQRPGTLALLALMLLALAIGHALGGPDPDDRTTLAVACATRHVALALLVAAAFPGTSTVALMVAYALASALVSIPYLAWRHRAAATISEVRVTGQS